MELRKQWKWELVRRLYERSYRRRDVQELFRLIDWLMVLPKAPEREFQQELMEFELEKQMPHITSIERFGIEKGIEKGRQQGAASLTIRQARKRFTAFGAKDEAAIRKLSLTSLEELSEALLDFAAIADLRTWLAEKRRNRE